jgi:hypothetical protein
LAYVKRAEAYLASHQEKSALADANHALDLDPSDAEAVATRDRAQTLLAPPPPPPPVQAANDGADKAAHDAAVASYEAEKKAAADNYAKQMADYDAQVKAENDRHAAELTAWQENVKACNAGMLSKCGEQSPKPVEAKTEPAKPAPIKTEAVKTEPANPAPIKTEVAKITPHPAPAGASGSPQKVATQTTAKAPAKPEKKYSPPPEPERPAIY